jgi:hypothetical protein
LFTHVRVDHKEKEGRIEELSEESEQGNSGQLGGLSLVVDPGDKSNNDSSNNPIDTGNHITERAVNEVSCRGSIGVDLTDWVCYVIIVVFIISCHILIHSVLLLFSVFYTSFRGDVFTCAVTLKLTSSGHDIFAV